MTFCFLKDLLHCYTFLQFGERHTAIMKIEYSQICDQPIDHLPARLKAAYIPFSL